MIYSYLSFNRNFKRIDCSKVQDIALKQKKAKVITTHPADSYIIDKEHNLVITKPDKFWSTSKYLVVVQD